jgi:hypothetical protein
MSIEAMKQALEALEAYRPVIVKRKGLTYSIGDQAITFLRQAIEQAQEPMGYMNAGYLHEMQQNRLPYTYVYPKEGVGCHVAVYTSPPPRQPLSDEQISVIVRETSKGPDIRRDGAAFQRVARAIEAAHGIKEKNHD